MLIQKLFVLLGLILLSVSCSTPAKPVAKKFKLDVTPFWVQDTLSQSNNGFRKINRMTPLIYKNQIVVGNALDGLVSYDLNSKTELWRIAIPFGIEASGYLAKDILFVGSNNGKMYSIDLTNQQILWFFDTKSEIVAEPLLVNGVLYFISGSQSVFALDASTGKQQWTYNRQDTANVMTIRGGSRPAYSNGFIYFGFSDGSLVSFNAKTGTPQWEISLNRNTRFKDIDSSPIIDGDAIYINSYDDSLYCLSKNKGEILWKSKMGGASTPILFSDKIITSSSRGELASLSKKDGTILWKTKTTEGIFVDPALFKGLVVAGESQGKLNFFDVLTGELKGSFEPGRGVFSKAAVAVDKNSVFFISGEGNVYGVHAEYNNKSSIYYLK